MSPLDGPIDLALPRLRLAGLDARAVRSDREADDWQALRSRQYRHGAASDRDRFDDRAQAILIRNETGTPVAGFRLFVHETAASAAAGYTGQFYRLADLGLGPGRTVEFGRVCIADARRASAVLRLLLAALTHVVDQLGAELLFGASSLAGADPVRHAGAVGWLRQGHIGPRDLCPAAFQPASMPEVPANPDGVPPLLRAYLSSGAFVGSDVVADHDLDTLHIFTALDPARVSAPRARLLRALAAQARAED